MKRLSIVRTVTALALALTAEDAGASANYSQTIREKLALTYTPDCGICHADSSGGDGRVVTDFGLSMQGFGMKGGDADSLRAAIDANRARKWDSDGDGIADVDELVRGIDPNGPALTRIAGPERGCAVAPSSSQKPFGFAPFGGGLLLLAVLARRSRSFRGRGLRHSRRR